MGFPAGHASRHCQGVLTPWKQGGTAAPSWLGNLALSTTHLGLAALFSEAFLPPDASASEERPGLGAGVWAVCLRHDTDILWGPSHLSSQTEKETFLDPFILRDLLPASLGSYYRYTGSLTTPPCSEIVEWIVFRRPVPISYHQVSSLLSFVLSVLTRFVLSIYCC